MSPQALLCSPDPQAVVALQRLLNSSGVELEICSQAEAATGRLRQQKFDAVFVDCDDMPLGQELLRELRKTPSNRHAIAFALLHGSTDVRKAYALGANFTLDKPLTVDFTTRTLRAAAGLMLRERRRYFRQDVSTNIQLWMKSAQLSGLITNLSESGMRLAQVNLKQGSKVRFQFTLPWTEVEVYGNGVVTWTGNGIAGVRLSVSRSLQRTLEDWVNDRAFRDKQFSSAVQGISTFAVSAAATSRGRRARA